MMARGVAVGVAAVAVVMAVVAAVGLAVTLATLKIGGEGQLVSWMAGFQVEARRSGALRFWWVPFCMTHLLAIVGVTIAAVALRSATALVVLGTLYTNKTG